MCGTSLASLQRDLPEDNASEDELILHYFSKDLEYNTILDVLREQHGVIMSLRTLKRRMKSLNLKRRNLDLNNAKLFSAENAIRAELTRGPGCLMGYRMMTDALKMKYNIRIPRWCTMRLLRTVDSVGVLQRRRRSLHRRTYCVAGPNYMWHADGHDKLKRFGFAIHACIDGFSRRIIWVCCSSSNNNASVIAHYYVTAVRELEGCPHVLRTDCGTENVIMAAIQCALRGSRHGHVYGNSQNNQRVESWWCFLRKRRMQWWIDLFDDLEQYGAINVARIDHIECMRFCFMGIIQRELAEVKTLWNGHRIRKSQGAKCPSGIPNQLFYFSGIGTRQCLININTNDCNQFTHQCKLPSTCHDTEFEEYLEGLCTLHNFMKPISFVDALQLYFSLTALLPCS